MPDMNLSREALKRQLQIEAFSALEAQLFLDTHPMDQTAIAYFNKHNKMARQLREEYTRRFGPISLQEYEVPADKWQWVQSPWPWEMEA